MAVTVKVFVPAKDAEAIQTTQYTATNATAIIDKATATNTTAGNLTLSVNLVTSGGVAGATNLVVSTRQLAAGETYNLPECVGQVLDSGGFISTIASGAGITIRFSGREVTT